MKNTKDENIFLSSVEIEALEKAITAAREKTGVHFQPLQTGGGFVQAVSLEEGIQFQLIYPLNFCVLRGVLMRDCPSSPNLRFPKVVANEDFVTKACDDKRLTKG